MKQSWVKEAVIVAVSIIVLAFCIKGGIESFVDKGFSVRVEHTIPDGYKAKTVYSFENGALREVSAC